MLDQIITYLLSAYAMYGSWQTAEQQWVANFGDPGQETLDNALVVAQLSQQAADCLNRPNPPATFKGCLQGVSLPAAMLATVKVGFHWPGSTDPLYIPVDVSVRSSGNVDDAIQQAINKAEEEAYHDTENAEVTVDFEPLRFTAAQVLGE